MDGTKPALPGIQDYSDYRKFLRDFYAAKKAANRNFSFRLLSQRAGINSSGFFKQIIEGERNLTAATIGKAAQALGLKDADAEYFHDLVRFNQAKTMKEKNLYFEKLIDQQKRRGFRRIPEDRYDYFSEWYHCVVRELAVIDGLGDDPARLAAAVRPALSPKQAAQSLQLLERLGFLKREAGGLAQSDPMLSTGYDIKSHLVKKFQIEMLRKAIEIYDRPSPGEPRLMSCNVFALSSAEYDRFVETLRSVRAQLMALAHSQAGPDRVYALNLNFFPVSDRLAGDAA